MRRWMLVVTPALAIVLLGGGLVLATDDDPQPLAPLPTFTPSPAPSGTPTPGPTGPSGAAADASTSPSTGGNGGGPTGPAIPTQAVSPTVPIGSPTDPVAGGTGFGSGGDQASTLTFTLSQSQPSPTQIVTVKVGDDVAVLASSLDVTDTLVFGGFDRRVRIRPGRPVTLTLHADEAGTFPVQLEDAGLLLAQITVRG